MKYCPICERNYPDDVAACELDGSTLRESRPAADPFVGKVIKGRYRVINKLGEGGMAAVYLAEQVTIERKAALKILHGQFANDPEFVKRFRQEAKLAASLNHPNLIKVYDFDQGDDGSLFIAMEYLEGKTLKEMLQAGAIAIPRATRLAIQIAEGLVVAHRAGVIHRDIKPENIMVTDSDTIKLMDFGIARLRESSSATRLTRAGMIMGTPLYMAPEQIEGSEVSEKTDIYAFGIVLYEMLSGAAPFRAPTPAAVLMKHLKEIPLPLRKLRSDIPLAVERIVSRTLEKKPERRPASMAEVVEALKSIDATFPQDVEKTLLATQPLGVIHSSELQSSESGRAARLRRGADAPLAGGTHSSPVSDSLKDGSMPYDTGDEPRSPGGIADTVALTQPLAVPRLKKKTVWVAVGIAATVLGAVALIVARTVRGPSPEVAQHSPAPKASPKAVLVSVSVRGDKEALTVGERLTLALDANYSDGRQEAVTEGIEWYSSNPAVAAIGAGGEIEARSPGQATVSARYGEAQAAPRTLTVRPPSGPRIVSVAIHGGKSELAVGARVLLRARATYDDGAVRDLKQNVSWQSSNDRVAGVNAKGEVEARNEGQTTITALFDGVASQPFAVEVKISSRPPQTKPVPVPQSPAAKPFDTLQQVKLARSYRDRGAYSEALAALEKARQMDPTNKEVLEEIAATRRACNAERKLGQSHLAC